MLLHTMRFLPLLLFACQGSGEYEHENVSISPVLEADPAPTDPAGTGEARAPRTTPGKAYGGATAGQGEPSPISSGLVPLSAELDPDSPRFAKRGGRYEATAGSGKDRFTWVVEPLSDGSVLDVIEIEDDGGRVRPFAGAVTTGLGKPRVLDQRRVGDALEVTYDNDLVAVFTPIGRSLRVDLERGGGLKRGRGEVIVGGVYATGRAKVLDVLRVPYFDVASVAALEVDRQARFLTAWVDPMASNATQLLAVNPDDRGPRGEHGYAQNTRYLDGTDGRRRPTRETLWVTWGTGLDEVLPSMDRPASPARDTLGGHFYVSYTNTPFREATTDVEELYGMGLEDLQLWMHHWQRDGYDIGYPDQVFPPRREWGGLVGLQELTRRADALGYGLGLHHNWVFNSVRTKGNTMLDSDGRLRANAEGGQFLKHRAALELVDQVEGQLHDEVGTRGTFSDSISTGFPIVDQDAQEPDWGMARGTLAAYLEILERLREIHGSPSAGEGSLGGGNVLFAGTVDAMPGSLFLASQPKSTNRNGRFVDVLPHFALGRLHELSVRAGVGPPRRFVAPDRWTTAGGFVSIERDLTQTMTALLGNAGYHWWYQLTRPGSVARDWWGGREAALALAAPGLELTGVTYFDDRGKGRSLEDHLLDGGTFEIGSTRVHLTYASGAELWANLTQSPWKPKGVDETLAPMGHLFVDGAVTAGIVQRGLATVQLSTGPDLRWVDGRGRDAVHQGLATDGAVGLRPIEAVDGGGWHVFPVPDYTLALPRGGSEEVVWTSYVELTAPLVEPGSYQLVWLDRNRLETHAEVVELGAEGLRVTMLDLDRHDARSLRVQPLD